MKTAIVTVAFLNPPKPGKSKANMKCTDESFYLMDPVALGLFEVGKTYEVEYTESTYNGTVYRTMKNRKEISGAEAEARKPGAWTPPDTGMTKDDYWRNKEKRDLAKDPRIERQHSQEQALRYFVAVGEKPSNMQRVKDMIDWFQIDIGKKPTIDEPSKQQEPQEEIPF